MTAIFMSTVSRVRRFSALRSVAAGLVVAGSAELGARLLSPRELPSRPPAAPLEEHFSAEEIARGRAFARPQRVLGMARTLVDGLVLLAAVRRPPRRLDRVASPVAGGALAGAGLTLALTGFGLPLGAVA